ncbi:unnamed protein product [Pleuronectes platessa]|uniref:Uncharacterized protein n=1 Tax=Pleuronectes platessa TaxID=8262 RepID=A0A9N7W1I2_PLEPL|nr:unnamed protein product [Pleuronectes platessa]
MEGEQREERKGRRAEAYEEQNVVARRFLDLSPPPLLPSLHHLLCLCSTVRACCRRPADLPPLGSPIMHLGTGRLHNVRVKQVAESQPASSALPEEMKSEGRAPENNNSCCERIRVWICGCSSEPPGGLSRAGFKQKKLEKLEIHRKYTNMETLKIHSSLLPLKS